MYIHYICWQYTK